MNEVKRYKAVINDKPYKPYAYCEESSDGIYVRLEDYAALQEQLTATTNSLTNAQEALKSAGIEADTVQAGVMELVDKLVEMQNRVTESEAEAEKNLAGAHAWEKHARRETAERDALAAENASIKSSIPNHKHVDLDNDNMDDVSLAEAVGFNDAVTLMNRWKGETPATDAHLNAVRADGLDMAAAEVDRWVGCDLLAREIRQKSAQLRAGNAGKDGWIEWGGGECPLERHIEVEVKHRSEKWQSRKAPACEVDWQHRGWCPDTDIIAYRVIKDGSHE